MATLSAIQNAAHYVKITVFEVWNKEKEAYEDVNIEGMVTGGSINVNGTSAIRRSGSLTMLVPEGTTYYKVTDIDNLISANKKIKVEIGLKDLDSDTDPIYYNMGIFVISAANVTHNLQGINISITLKDLMCTLNGELGGMFMQTTVHTPYYDVVSKSMTHVKLRDLIKTLVQEYTNLSDDKINIPDDAKTGVPAQIKNTVRWTGTSPIYGYDLSNNSTDRRGFFITSQDNLLSTKETYEFNDNIGYVYTDFTYPTDKELVSNAGESVMSVLDKIKSLLGNYEYFFDVDGKFHFQKIPNYQEDSGSAQDILQNAMADYLVKNTGSKAEYEIPSTAVNSYGMNPNYSGIKNDITAWGQFSDSKIELGYHLIIDQTPTVSPWTQSYTVHFALDEAGTLRAYPSRPEDITNDNYKGAKTYATADLNSMDWRQQIYLDYVLRKSEAGYKRSPYSLEIANSWPLIYDVQNLRFYTAIYKNGTIKDTDKKKLNSLPYFIDVLDPFKSWANEALEIADNETARLALQELTITKMGRRPWSKKDDKVNCIFNPEFPNRIYIQAGEGEQTKKARNKALADIIADQSYEKDEDDTTTPTYPELVQVTPGLYSGIAIGSVYNSAYDWVRSILHEMTTYNEQINITCMPLYQLEPNMRIKVTDAESDIDGDYVIKSMSIPLAHNGTMTIQASKAIERI